MATALMPQPEERKDWEKAKDWLQNVVLQRHIHTIDVRNFNKIKTEWHLYLYLKVNRLLKIGYYGRNVIFKIYQYLISHLLYLIGWYKFMQNFSKAR